MSTSITSMLVFLAVFAAIGGVGLFVHFWLQRDRYKAIARLRRLHDEDKPADGLDDSKPTLGHVLPSAGKLLMPQEVEQAGYWKSNLQRAGYRNPNALLIFLGVKLVLLVALPVFAVSVPLAVNVLPLNWSLIAGTIVIAAAFFGPNFWVHWRVRIRQAALRRGMPDALDMMVLCLEGGVSLPASIQRVTDELHTVSPPLAQEMALVQREIDLGMSPGEAFQRLGDRCNLEEARSLGAVLVQTERFGSGIAKSLRLHSDAWRQERQQRAEEQAHRAAVMILFPMLICIFPAIFIVTLAPAAFQIAQLFER